VQAVEAVEVTARLVSLVAAIPAAAAVEVADQREFGPTLLLTRLVLVAVAEVVMQVQNRLLVRSITQEGEAQAVVAMAI
jgi:hypothetical protein